MRIKLLCLLLLLPLFAAAQTPCATRPPAGSPSAIYRDGTRLCWDGAPLRLTGYYTIDLATRDNFDFTGFLNKLRYVENANPSLSRGVNFTRIWATGNSNNPDCFHTPTTQDPLEHPMTVPFALMPGESCTAAHVYPKYNMCISTRACSQVAGLNPQYTRRLQQILAEARNNGIIVELVLFDAYFLGRHQDANALYATNPWNPLNNNMDRSVFRRFPGSNSFSSCEGLYRSTDRADQTDDAFPEFYNICSDTSSTDKCDRTLNCLGLIQKAYVETMVDLVRATPGGGDHVMFEIMNRATFDKRDAFHEGFDVGRFQRWNDTVGRWIKCRGDNDCRNTRGDYLVMAEVGLAEYSDLACTKPSDCPNNPQAIFALPNVDVVDFQGHTWKNTPGAPGPCKTALTALGKFGKPVAIDTDSALERMDKCQVAKWAREIRACGNAGEAHLIHLDGMTTGYSPAKQCGFRGKGTPEVNEDFDEKYLDCHTLDTLGFAAPTFLRSIVTTQPAASCPHSVNVSGTAIWCTATCN